MVTGTLRAGMLMTVSPYDSNRNSSKQTFQPGYETLENTLVRFQPGDADARPPSVLAICCLDGNPQPEEEICGTGGESGPECWPG
jgi:hypothetical protein